MLHRVVWSLLICLMIVALRGGGDAVLTGLRTGSQVGPLTLAAALIAVNWGTYVYAVNSNQVIEASLG